MLWLIVERLLKVAIVKGDRCWVMLLYWAFCASWRWWKRCARVSLNDVRGTSKKFVMWVNVASVSKEGMES